MVILGIHNELNTTAFSRSQTVSPRESILPRGARSQTGPGVFDKTELAGVNLAELLRKIRELPKLDDGVLQQAVARFETGQLLTRETGQHTAASQLSDFVY